MIRALVFGATGYTGIELMRILASHPDVAVTGGSSRNWEGKRVSELFPSVDAQRDFVLRSADELKKDPEGDVAFLALPHGQAAGVIRPVLEAGLKVIDLSADCRLRDPSMYAEWYGPHCDPELMQHAVYGLPEIHREEIRQTDLVANPGCYPTSVILGLAPLVNLTEVDTTRPVVDSKSGISGAGRGAKLNTSFCEAGEGFKPYAVTGHRHISEMEQELSGLAGERVLVRFTPHLLPISRGIVSTMYLPLKASITVEKLRQAYNDYYASEPFIRVLSPGVFPDTAQVRGSNQCHIAVELDERTGLVIAMAAIDNLVKGASGAAVQNMNIVLGLAETAGLAGLPLFP
ncbi:MAG: N-acetyl-gamma-glutamyl-phosphate reductase [Desulfomonile tiedjei]|nr:N-acetyl-gamma-glutamyl-phosphate reductase [Desulfomonile tiedjei]